MTITSTSPFNRSDWIVIGGGAVAVVLAGVTRYLGGGVVIALLCSAFGGDLAGGAGGALGGVVG